MKNSLFLSILLLLSINHIAAMLPEAPAITVQPESFEQKEPNSCSNNKEVDAIEPEVGCFSGICPKIKNSAKAAIIFFAKTSEKYAQKILELFEKNQNNKFSTIGKIKIADFTTQKIRGKSITQEMFIDYAAWSAFFIYLRASTNAQTVEQDAQSKVTIIRTWCSTEIKNWYKRELKLNREFQPNFEELENAIVTKFYSIVTALVANKLPA